MSFASSAVSGIGADLILAGPPQAHAEPQFPRVEFVEPAASVGDGSVDIIFLALPTFAEQFAALVSWTPKLRKGGVLVVYWALTTADVAAAVYIYAGALPLS